jgi:hypothetical protein
MTTPRFFWAAWCCLAGVCLAAGCRPSTEQLAPVKGKVLYKGRPLQGGVIVFTPDTGRGTHGNLAVADIQPDGTFTLKTNDVLGAVTGYHRVTVGWVQPPPGPGAAPVSLLPAKYRDPNQSGLSCEVVANKTNTIDFELE